MEKISSFNIMENKEEIKKTFLSIIENKEFTTDITIDEDELSHVLNDEKGAKASSFILNTPYEKNLSSPYFLQLLSRLSIAEAKGIIVQITASPELKLSNIRDIMSAILESSTESCRVLMGSKQERVRSGYIALFIIAAGLEPK